MSSSMSSSMSYSPDEIASATALVTPTVLRSTGSLGEAVVEDNYDAVKILVGTSLALNPAAALYLVLLGIMRIMERVTQISNTIAVLNTMVLATQYPGDTVDIATGLAGAINALTGLVGQNHKDIGGTAQYRAYLASINKILESSRQLVHSGTVWASSAEAVSKLPGLIQDTQQQDQDIRILVGYVVTAIQNLEALGLGSVITDSVITSALSQLSTINPSQSSASLQQGLRELTLMVLAQKAVIASTLGKPSTALTSATGTLSPFQDSSHAAIPASLTSTIPGPYSIQGSQDLTILHETIARTITVSSSYVAQLQGSVVGPYEIGSGNGTLIIRSGTTSSFTTTSSDLIITLTPGPTVSVAQVVLDINSTALAAGVDIEALEITVPGGSLIELRYNSSTSVQDRGFIMILDDSSNTAPVTLGFVRGMRQDSGPTRARDVANMVNHLDTAGICSTVFTPTVSFNARTDPNNRSRISIFRTRAVGVLSTGSALHATVTFPSGTDMTGIIPGDILVVRSGINTGLAWDIVSVMGLVVTGVGTTPVPDPAALVEIGVARAGLLGQLIQIPSTDLINQGLYEIVGYGLDNLTYQLGFGIPQPQDPVTGTGLDLAIMIGDEGLVFNSRDTSLASRVQVTSPGGFSTASIFFLAGTGLATGMTRYASITSGVVTQGDIARFFPTSYVSSTANTITSVEGLILGLSFPISSIVTWVIQSGTGVVPYVQIGSGTRGAYETLVTRLTAWLELQNPEYWVNLNRFINPLLLGNPGIQKVSAALAEILVLQNQYGDGTSTTDLVFALSNYQTSRVPVVDTILQTLQEKGADRARDLLLQGRFSEFFGLDHNTCSYASALLSSTREVARNDLVVRKQDRQDRVQQRILGTYTSQDPEYDRSDIDQVGVPDLPSDRV